MHAKLIRYHYWSQQYLSKVIQNSTTYKKKPYYNSVLTVFIMKIYSREMLKIKVFH